MATGPQRARLDTALSGAYDTAIDDSALEWNKCTQHLWTISRALENASPAVKEEIGGQTGPAIDAAFAKSATGMTEKAELLSKGSLALQAAADAIKSGRQEQHALASQPLTEPAPYHPPPGQPTPQDLHAEAQNRRAHADYAAAYADQERRAKERADHMDRVFEQSTAVMKEIHGIPDKDGTGDPATGGGPGPASAGGYTPPHASSGGPGPATGPHGGRPAGPHNPSVPHGPGPRPYEPGPGSGPGYLPGGAAPQGGGNPFEYTPGGGSVAVAPAGSSLSPTTGLGVAGAAAGGIGGGMLATGLAAGGIRPGLTPVVANPGTAASSVRGIGATARSGVSGALGRSGSSGTAAAGPSSATGRGAAGARGTGRSGRAGTAGAAGRRGKDDKKGRQHELFDVGEDWVDDEDAAPGVLD